MVHKNRLGLHLRLHATLSALARTAKALRLPFFQFFLKNEVTKKSFFLTKEDECVFMTMRPLFAQIYVHASYAVNVAADKIEHPVLSKELALSTRLQVTHYVLHPGAIQPGIDRKQLLERVVRLLNKVVKEFTQITFCIENTANKNSLIGADIDDCIYIQERIDIPERVMLCIDTAHAHAAGYDLNDAYVRESVIERLTGARPAVALIHFNDLVDTLGSYIDKHELPGKGTIGKDSLSLFVQHKKIEHVPLLIEPPAWVSSFEQMKKLIDDISSW